MADEWVGIRAQLPNDPKLISVARFLLRDAKFREWFGADLESLPTEARYAALRGVTLLGFVRIWAVGNSRGVTDSNGDAILHHCDFSTIDEIAGVPGIASAMESVHWLYADEVGGVSACRLPNFCEYNRPVESRSDKEKSAREMNRERQRRHRRKKALQAVTVTLRHDNTEQNRTEQEPSIHPPNPLPLERVAGWVDGVSWSEVMGRLAKLGVVNARQAVAEARDACGATPELAMTLLDFAEANGKGPGAIVWRFKRAVPSMPLDVGWPMNGDEDHVVIAKAEKAAEKKRREEDEMLATKIIKTMRKAKKPNDEIVAELKRHNLEWPK